MTKIACVAVVKDEARHIAEWIAYQFVIGFDTVIILDNLSTDETKSIASRFAPRWDVRVLDAPFTGPDFQGLAYERALTAYSQEFEWMAFFDADEFLLLDNHKILPLYLENFSYAQGIAVNWSIFGSSGYQVSQPGLTIETYLYRGKTDFDANRHIKSIVRPGSVKKYLNPHMFDIDGVYVDLAGRPLDCEVPGIISGWPDHNGGKLNHYFSRSREDWLKKLRRGYRDTRRNENDFNYYNCNDVYDDAAAKFSPQVKNILKALHEPNKNFAAVVLMAKNEASDILAWLAWYDLLGFNAFIVFDDDSDDGTWEILQDVSKNRDIRLFRSLGQKPGRYEFRQEICYKYALERYRDEFEWMAFFDIDEYLALFQHNSIEPFLNAHTDADSVSINWCNYGSSGHILKPALSPVETYTWHSNEQQPINRHVKAIVRPARVGPNWIGVHCFDVHPSKSVLAGGRAVAWGPTPGIIDSDPDWKVAKIMHFQCRSMEHFIERIKKRPDLANLTGIFQDSDFAQVQDTRPVSLGEKLRSRAQEIRSSIAHEKPPPTDAGLPYSYIPNPIGKLGFVMGLESAALGNKLSSFANLFTLGERNSLITSYRQIMSESALFNVGDNAGFYITDDLPPELFGEFDQLARYVDEMFSAGGDHYAKTHKTISLNRLEELEHLSGVVVFSDYLPEFQDLSLNEHKISRFCRQGNGIILAGAYWHQYLDMRAVAPHGERLRQKFSIHCEDGAGDRALAMLAAGREALRIGIHIRRHPHYEFWQGGRYLFSVEQYAAVTRKIHQSLGERPHCFFIFSDETLDLTPFVHLPFWYENGSAEDDFVALSRCHYVIGPPSTFATWAAFLGGAKRLILTAERLANLPAWDRPLDDAVEILFPTGGYLPGDPAARPI